MRKIPRNTTRPAFVALIVLALVAGGIPGLAGGTDPASTQESSSFTVCASGCDQTTIQGAVDQASSGDTVLVHSGTYEESVAVAAGKQGFRLLGLDGPVLRPSTGNPLAIEADDVVVHGFTIDSGDTQDAVVASGHGLVLRDNTILGGLEVSGGVHVDARANHWGTDDYDRVLNGLSAPTGSVTAAPFLLSDGSQDPPAPTVEPSGHCDGAGFTPRFIEEAVWCAHAGGVVVLHPSTSTPPTPHGIIVDPDTPANLIYQNRDITGTIAGGAVPVWAPGWGGETLTGLILCSGMPKSSAQDPPEPTPDGPCIDNAEGVIVDAGVGPVEYATGQGDNKPMTHTLDVRADDVRVSGLTVQHTTNQDDRHGLIVRSDRVDLIANVIVGNFLPSEHNGGPTLNQIGAILPGSDAFVEGNEVRNWRNIGLYLPGSSGEGNQVLDNLVQESRWHGILIEGPKGAAPTLEVRGNEIHDHGHSAIRFGSGDTAGYQIRENVLGLSNLNAVTVQSGTQDAAIDVRLNDWGFYRYETLPARVDDESGTNTVKQVPFMGVSGAPDPALPVNPGDGSHSTVPATCNAHPDADWDASSGACVYLSIQAAVDFVHAAGTVLVPGSASTPPTPYLENVVIRENSLGEPLDGLTLCSTGDGSTCSGEPLSTRIDGSLTGDPALIVQDASDVGISGLTFQGSSPSVRILFADGASFAGNTVESVPSTTSAQQGLAVSDSQGVDLSANRFLGNAYPGSVSLNLEGSDDAVIGANEIQHAGTAVRVADSHRARIEVNQVFQPPVTQFGGASLGISLLAGADHTTAGNLLFGAGSGLRVSGSTGASSQEDHFLVQGTGVGLSEAGGVQPTGASVNDGHLVAAGTPLHLDASTAGLDVDATCNDWGTYTASGVQSRIEDEGTGNLVDFVPFRAPDSSSTTLDCLQLPSVSLTADPEEVVPGQEVAFEVETESDRPVVLREWNFGDGQTFTQNAPFVNDVTHAYTDSGTFFATVVVTDSEGGQGIGVAPLTVHNPAPLIHGVDHVNVEAGTSISLNYTVIDPDGGDVDLVAQNLPTGAALLEDPAPDRWRFGWTPALDQAGTWQVSLMATDDEGATGLLVLELVIEGEAPERRISFVNAGARPGPTAPGATHELVTKIENLGGSQVQVGFSNATPAGWQVDSPDSLILAPGEEQELRFNVTLGPVDGSGRVTLRALVLGSPESSKTISYVIEAPLSVAIEMEETTLGSEITGTVQVTYTDGSPAAGALVTGSRLNGPDVTGAARSGFSGYVNETGEVAFSFPVSDLAAQLPGTHIVEANVWTDRHNYRGHTSYQVGLL